MKQKTIGKVWFVCKVIVLEPVVLLPVKKLQYYLHFKKVCDPKNSHLNLDLNIRINPLYLNLKFVLSLYIYLMNVLAFQNRKERCPA